MCVSFSRFLLNPPELLTLVESFCALFDVHIHNVSKIEISCYLDKTMSGRRLTL